ncbi:hypothetical protein E4T43_07746 [Aureobasidium subglaciale]|nr:hypothetical protein E4T43_07746 [Aureobasidium subglaciale]
MLSHSGDYELVVRQQPKEALVTQPGKEKNRKPVDPPPIIELKVTSNADPGKQFLQSPYLFMQCTLQVDQQSSSSEHSSSQVIPGQEITGQSVSSLHRLKDINNEDGGFFVFGDISIKLLGKHRLNFSLFELRKDTGEVVFLRSITSEPFDVVQQKQWRGLVESTHLSRTFSDQGVRLRLRKENRSIAGYGVFGNESEHATLTTGHSSKRTFPYSPRSSTQAGPSSTFGYDDDPNKRHRPNEHAQQQAYSMTERAPLASYDPRPAPQNMAPTPYNMQQQALLQSPQTSSYGSRTPSAPSGWPHSQIFNPTHGSTSAPARFPEGAVDTAQGITPSPGAVGYALQPAPSMGHDSGPFPRRSTDSYMSVSHQHPQTSPTTPFQGPGAPMFIPTSSSIPGQSAYTSEHDPASMVRQHTQAQSVASPASSTRSGMIQAAPAYSMQPQSLPHQTYGAMPENPSFEYQFRQPAYPPQSLLQQPSSNPNHEIGRHTQSLGTPIDMRTTQLPSPYMQQQSHQNLAIRPQHPGESYGSTHQAQPYPPELAGHSYQAPGQVPYPPNQAPDPSRPY